MGLPSLGVYYCVRFYPPPTGRAFCNFQVSVIRCIACYPTTIGKNFLLWIVPRLPPMTQKCSQLKWISQEQEQPSARHSTLWQETSTTNSVIKLIDKIPDTAGSDIPDTAGRKTRRGRRRGTQAIANRYAFHAIAKIYSLFQKLLCHL